jgi:recombination protein RecR
MIPKKLKELIKFFSDFPTVGERSATKFALHLLNLPENVLEDFAQKILNLKKEVKRCKFCFAPFSPKKDEEICPICQDKTRENILCVVEKEADFWQIEKTKKYRGFYFILGGTLEFLKEDAIGKIRYEELKKRIKEMSPKEVILALDPTKEGIFTMDFLTHSLKPLCPKITRLGKGLPLGGEIEYADEETIASSFEARK